MPRDLPIWPFDNQMMAIGHEQRMLAKCLPEAERAACFVR